MSQIPKDAFIVKLMDTAKYFAARHKNEPTVVRKIMKTKTTKMQCNCNGNHPAYFRSCPKWKMEQKILQIKYEENISFHEARKRVEPSVSDPSRNSCASTTELHPWSNTITHPSHFKSEEAWLSHTIEDCLKRLEAIKQKLDTISITNIC